MPANDIDELMSQDPLGMSRQDIAAIVAYYRNRRAAPVPKVKKEKGLGLKIDAAALGLKVKPTGPVILRRPLK